MLKQSKYILAILFAMAVCVSCQKDDNADGDTIKPFAYTLSNSNKYSKQDAGIVDFFNGFTKPMILRIFNYSSDYGYFDCLVINSMDELRETLLCLSVEPPEIDFSRYTLLMGCFPTPTPSHFLAKQNLSVTPDKLVLTLATDFRGDIHFFAEDYVYFWGLYPKLPDKDVELNLILKKL